MKNMMLFILGMIVCTCLTGAVTLGVMELDRYMTKELDKTFDTGRLD